MHPLRTFIAGYRSLDDDTWSRIEEKLSYQPLRKEALLLKKGQVCRHLYFAEKGLLRFYSETAGEEFTKFFTEAPYLFTSQRSFTKMIPAEENIQAIEDCELWVMTLNDANALMELEPWSSFIRQLIQEVQFYTENIYQEMQSLTAENRYRRLLQSRPGLVQRIPLKYLASYLGIAQASLSRIRKNISKEKGI